MEEWRAKEIDRFLARGLSDKSYYTWSDIVYMYYALQELMDERGKVKK